VGGREGGGGRGEHSGEGGGGRVRNEGRGKRWGVDRASGAAVKGGRRGEIGTEGGDRHPSSVVDEVGEVRGGGRVMRSVASDRKRRKNGRSRTGSVGPDHSSRSDSANASERRRRTPAYTRR